MFACHNIPAVFLVLLVLVATSAGKYKTNLVSANCSGTCTLQFRCSPYNAGPFVWSIVDGACQVFGTYCMFNSKNCQRQNECLSQMVETTQQNCQQNCPQCNGLPVAPVCGIHSYVDANGSNADEYINFNNECELRRHACENAMAFHYYAEGPCF